MKLNPNCIRGLLLTIEEKCDFDTPWEYQKDYFEAEYLAEFNHNEILYHIKQSEEAGLIQGVHYYDGGDNILVCDLTPAGHEFLANVRNEKVWKKVIAKAADASLPILFEVAKNLAATYFLG